MRPHIIFLLTLIAFQVTAKEKNSLIACWNKQVKVLEGHYINFSFQETLYELEHNFQPWQQSDYTAKGMIWLNAGNFFKTDSLFDASAKAVCSRTQLSRSSLLFQDYGAKELFAVTTGMFLDQPFKISRYSPALLIDYFAGKKVQPDKETNSEYVVYKESINGTIVKLYIRRTDDLIARITTLGHDEFWGDVTTTYTYHDYRTMSHISYAGIIRIEKLNGRIKDEVRISPAVLTGDAPVLLTAPEGYALKEETVTTPVTSISQYSSNIHFIELKHTDDKVMIVEFKDFLLVAEAPLNSRNGELIISEAGRIAPGKPVRYFVFGHHHPHYIGGIRPFVHQGVRIICSKENESYATYLAEAPHTLQPDRLQTDPKPIRIERISDSTTISDGIFEMKIYFIGERSAHTNDYLIYYFPSEKLLFEDDLVWISRQGAVKKAGKRQAGLFHAIRELGLDVKLIVQSWPVADYGVKTMIPFEDLEISMSPQLP